jgi:3-dehydroquinate synthase
MSSELEEVVVELGDASYPYLFGLDCLAAIGEWLAKTGADRHLVVSDDRVLEHYGDSFLPGLAVSAPVTVLSESPGEADKTLPKVALALEQAIAAGATRRTVVVAFGGGATGNRAGLLAGLLYRGIRLVHVPTTITAAMDSVLSLKQAVNSSLGKNHIGLFYRPTAVLTDLALLQALPAREVRSGVCEAIKNCLAIRPKSIAALRQVLRDDLLSPESLRWLLIESITAKSTVMQSDPCERGRAMILEYGHTVGHAIEYANVSPGSGVSHGEAIGLGMLVAGHVALQRDWLSPDDLSVHRELLAEAGVQLQLPPETRPADLLARVAHDNKRGYIPVADDEVAMVLLRGLGIPAGEPDLPLVPVALAEIEDAIEQLAGGGCLAGADFRRRTP